MRILLFAFTAFCLLAKPDPGLAQRVPDAKSNQAQLGSFWPVDAASKKWTLISALDRIKPQPRILMSVTNEPVGNGTFILWFSKPEFAQGYRNGERYRVCSQSRTAWLYFDSYINAPAGSPAVDRPVQSDKIIYTPAGGQAVDLLANGDYARCGGMGQPYLMWAVDGTYRIQVWGHMVRNPKFRWYWDATVSGPEYITTECSDPPRRESAIRVREAWWSNFHEVSGKWTLGSGGVSAAEMLPTGENILYGRTVWHGAHQIPYLMIGDPIGRPRWCVGAYLAR